MLLMAHTVGGAVFCRTFFDCLLGCSCAIVFCGCTWVDDGLDLAKGLLDYCTKDFEREREALRDLDRLLSMTDCEMLERLDLPWRPTTGMPRANFDEFIPCCFFD